MLNGPFSSWPSFSKEEADAVRDVLLTNQVNYWTGREGRDFEREFACFAEAKYAIALANGTVALDLALKALGIGIGDEVIVTSRTFLASVSSIVNSGAMPVFADVDRDSQNITAETISAVITSRTKAIICVHLAGWPCDMDPIMSLASGKGLFVIEDCAQAHGAKYKNQSVGSIGHIGCWSFCQDKIMTTGGEGGMVTTNDHSLWSSMWSFKDHGKSWGAVYEQEHPPGFRWLHESFGTNWRMTEMQAVIGRIQIKKMDEWQSVRLKYAEQIWDAVKDLDVIRVPEVPSTILHAAYKCYFFVDVPINEAEKVRDHFMAEINAKGVPCFSGTCSEVYLEKAFDGTGIRPKNALAFAQELGKSSLMCMCHPTLTQEEIDKTCEVLRDVFQRPLP
ncbi:MULTISPECIES: DegT/DnrJ/EryC1/StrS aminotransferase family protein [unclassified Neptuniibacter]|uniref:DegT/DnrJ/EryC1/StrS family aminotransferase n=1 Tax=unclassified Neptuniibacter TaxID=2630693 RepID=UPI000C425D4B|nr:MULTISPECIES: DegT/DnrJ/EryC1/StrS aminotransferase family protein [unclassified Neptuniibacter]MAY42205.1 aminotransferase [Oceanospirillaceae bacterium]|tara:strand:+ start:17113 stop:18288 length:1176 start_codon:yes stop_codon:yes gene_type:complete